MQTAAVDAPLLRYRLRLRMMQLLCPKRAAVAGVPPRRLRPSRQRTTRRWQRLPMRRPLSRAVAAAPQRPRLPAWLLLRQRLRRLLMSLPRCRLPVAAVAAHPQRHRRLL
jgi:hypothetical protein